ncbi:trypsin-like peptidase domain-containing protein [Yinghuangia sp. YIM S09857]|uniref:S1C family serine protease n=1 Tax=Yinghuangia sp. YIM S09857 TaxID=3436929 RepID=UPI003F534220
MSDEPGDVVGHGDADEQPVPGIGRDADELRAGRESDAGAEESDGAEPRAAGRAGGADATGDAVGGDAAEAEGPGHPPYKSFQDPAHEPPAFGGAPAPVDSAPAAPPPPPPTPAWGFPHPAGQPTLPPNSGTPYAHPAAAHGYGPGHAAGQGGPTWQAQGYGQPYGFGWTYDADSGPGGLPYGDGGFGAMPPGYPPGAYAFPVEEPREPVKWTWRIGVGLACIALAAGALGGGIGVWVADRDEKGVTLRQPTSSGPERPRDTVAGLAATTLPGVVYIHASRGGEQASGTGFVLDGNGYILTNNHVVSGAANGGRISVVFNGGEQADATIVGRDTGYDLAVIRVHNVKGLVPLPLGNSDSVQVGDPVIAIGAPYNLEGTVTSGIISAKDRAVSAGGSGEDVSYISALQTDAPINPGNSGGPLIDASGRVIGVNSAIRSAGEESDPFGGEGAAGSIGLGFAIPINQAKRVAQQLIDDGKAVHPVIGVTLDMQYEGEGARISDKDFEGRPPVLPDGPAARAGLQPGDVVTAIDGKRVAEANELIVAVRSKAPGDTVTLTVKRGDAELSLPIKLEGESG